jgi:gamma-glutamyltranspeptidase/glutathione hydrolase
MPFGVMGGQYQAVGHAQLITHLVARGLDPQEAIDEPRTFAFGGLLEVESTVSANVVADLARRGHSVKRCTQPIGGAQAIQIDRRRGLLLGGSDARKDGLALGL